MNYILFGGTGFIGTHLARLINKCDPSGKIYNLDIVKPGEPLPSLQYYKPALFQGEKYPATYIHCDVRNPIDVPFEVSPDDVIFNLAAVHRTPGHYDEEYFETNIKGAENVTAFAEKYGVKTMIFTSSISAYGASEDLKEETTSPTPNAAYGISKLDAEKIHLVWAKKSETRRLLVVRPGVVFGRGENGNFSRLFSSIKSKKFAYPGRTDTIKACMYVKDLVSFIWWWLQQNRKESVELFNCTFEPAFTIKYICDSMKKVTGMNVHLVLVPSWILMPMAWCAKLLGSPLGICPERVHKLIVSTNISGKKLAQCGYKFQYTFEEALKDWWKDCDNQCLE